MDAIKIYTRQDKAAFLNHLKKFNINVNSNDVEDVKKDQNNKSYFILKNLNTEIIKKIKDMFKGHKDIEISTGGQNISEGEIREIIRETIEKIWKSKKKDVFLK